MDIDNIDKIISNYNKEIDLLTNIIADNKLLLSNSKFDIKLNLVLTISSLGIPIIIVLTKSKLYILGIPYIVSSSFFLSESIIGIRDYIINSININKKNRELTLKAISLRLEVNQLLKERDLDINKKVLK